MSSNASSCQISILQHFSFQMRRTFSKAGGRYLIWEGLFIVTNIYQRQSQPVKAALASRHPNTLQKPTAEAPWTAVETAADYANNYRQPCRHPKPFECC